MGLFRKRKKKPTLIGTRMAPLEQRAPPERARIDPVFLEAPILRAPGPDIPEPRSPRDRARGGTDYKQYDIQDPRWAESLRKTFDLTGGSGFALASEIVPVMPLTLSAPGIPFVCFAENAAVTGGLARLAVQAGQRTVLINSVELFTSTRVALDVIIPRGEFGTVRTVLNLAPSLGEVTARVMFAGDGGVLLAPANSETLLANLDPQGTPGMRREFFPAPIVLAPGEMFHVHAMGITAVVAMRVYGSEAGV